MNMQIGADWPDEVIADTHPKLAAVLAAGAEVDRVEELLRHARNAERRAEEMVDRWSSVVAWYQADPRKFVKRGELAEVQYLCGTSGPSWWIADRPTNSRRQWDFRDRARRPDRQPRGFRRVDREWLCCGAREECEMRFDRFGNPAPEEGEIVKMLAYYHRCEP